LIRFIILQLLVNLPVEFKVLAEVATELPGNDRSPVHPFLSLVFNLNPVTKGHRDSADLDICLVLPIGNFLGGQLVLKEAGLVVELWQGDFIVFQSAKVTHFNTHYQGRRASMVLHTDKEMKHWATSHNGWGENITLSAF
jgi:hypothetical protein